jgi:uncharacterized protein with HEPN domain
MSQRDPGDYLEDIEHYAAAAVRFTSRLSLEQYLADEKTRAAVERVQEVCREAMSNLYRVAPTVAETIPHARDIIGFRNILAHRDSGDVIWRVPTPVKGSTHHYKYRLFYGHPGKRIVGYDNERLKGRSRARWRIGGPIRLHERGARFSRRRISAEVCR